MKRSNDWVLYFKQMLSPESRLGALRGAYRDGVLDEVLSKLGVTDCVALVELLHQDEIPVRDYKEPASQR